MTKGSTSIAFKLLGGQLSLDFVNTVGGWAQLTGGKRKPGYDASAIRDKLSNYEDLLAWGRQAGVLPERDAKRLLRVAGKQPKAADDVLKRGRKLRETLYRLFRAVLENWRPEPADLRQLNDELQISRAHQRLVCKGNRLEWGWDENAEDLDRVIWPLALSAADLLSGDLSRLRQCSGGECGWLFLDTSRNRSRQWCAMNDCGNLAKVRRFRERQAGSA